MAIAEEQARRFKGETEAAIEKSFNYATAVHTGQNTMVGNDHPWCAAFVNWCLMQAGVAIENPTFADNVASKGRAHGFLEIRGERGPDNGMSMVRNPRFVTLDEPVFGSIAMVTSREGHGHHVGFTYSRPESGSVVLLGGNQSDRIMFQSYRIGAAKGHPDHLQFLFPAAWSAPGGATAAMETRTADQLNASFGISLNKMKLKDSTK
jgi:uncharacterized protein (TIGR02594 family)